MTRSDLLLELAREVRGSHTAALQIVGWWAATAPENELEACLGFIREARGVLATRTHLEAYRERWGRVPDEAPRT